MRRREEGGDRKKGTYSHYCHFILCKSTRLITANIWVVSKSTCKGKEMKGDTCSTTHGLASSKMPHEIVFLEQLEHTVREGDRDGEGETLRHSHHDNSDGIDNELHDIRTHVLPELFCAKLLVDLCLYGVSGRLWGGDRWANILA